MPGFIPSSTAGPSVHRIPTNGRKRARFPNPGIAFMVVGSGPRQERPNGLPAINGPSVRVLGANLDGIAARNEIFGTTL